jgi:hypothetical protein
VRDKKRGRLFYKEVLLKRSLSMKRELRDDEVNRFFNNKHIHIKHKIDKRFA